MKEKDRTLQWIFFWIVFFSEAIYGIYLGVEKHALLGDAVSRTANAFYVFFSKPLHLTSMGLVWNPLPSVLQFLFVLLAKKWRFFVTEGVGAAIMTALFAAWAAKRLLFTFDAFSIQRNISIPLTLLYCFNPYVFYYGANGMSEMLFITFIILAVSYFSQWLVKGEGKFLPMLAFSLVGMFLVRYEAIPFALSVGAAMAIHILVNKREKQYYPANDKWEPFHYVQASFWVTFFPLIYVVVVWIIYNYSITGNPLYFMNSGYSMSAYSDYYQNYGGLSGALSFVWVRIWPFLLYYAAIVLILVLNGKLLTTDFFMISVITLGFSLFQVVMISMGSSGGYIRYICYPLMTAAAWFPYLFRIIQPHRRKTSFVILLCVMLFNNCYFSWGFKFSSLLREDTLLNVPSSSKQVADYINSYLPNNRILMDSYRTYYAIMNINNIDNLVISCSPDFEESVADPVANDIDYIVVPEIGSYGNMDALNIAHPDLYWKGEPWSQEVTKIGEFKIIQVLK